jgi:hypothetical protein
MWTIQPLALFNVTLGAKMWGVIGVTPLVDSTLGNTQWFPFT